MAPPCGTPYSQLRQVSEEQGKILRALVHPKNGIGMLNGMLDGGLDWVFDDEALDDDANHQSPEAKALDDDANHHWDLPSAAALNLGTFV